MIASITFTKKAFIQLRKHQTRAVPWKNLYREVLEGRVRLKYNRQEPTSEYVRDDGPGTR